jgi:hypothetical protein
LLATGYVYKLLKPSLQCYTAFRYLEKFDLSSASIMKPDRAYEILITHQFFNAAFILKKWPAFLRKTKVGREYMWIDNYFTLSQVTDNGARLKRDFDIRSLDQCKTIHPSDLKMVLGKFTQRSLIQVKDLSNSADLYLVSDIGVVVGVQMKSGSVKSIGYTKLREEFNKAQLPENSVYVMMALKYTDELNSVIDTKNQYLLLKEGIYYTFGNVLIHNFRKTVDKKTKEKLKHVYYDVIKWKLSINKNQDSSCFKFHKKEYIITSNGAKKDELLQILQKDYSLNEVLKVPKNVEVVVVSSELIEFLGEENWRDLEEIKSVVNDKTRTLQLLSLKRFDEYLLADNKKRTYGDAISDLSYERAHKRQRLSVGSGQQMITTLNQEPFDLASWIANQMGLDVQIEEEKNRLNELISAFRKAGYRTLKAVKKINNVAIDSINKQLREKGCEELQEGEKACLLDE